MTILTSPAELHPLLSALGPNSAEVEARGCDFMFVGSHGLVGCQRKEVKDLVASIQSDDRLCVELGQIAGSDLAHVVFIIEGNWAWDSTGQSMTTGYTRAQLDGVLLSLQVEHGATVMHTDTVADTAALLIRMESWFSKAVHGSLQVRKKSRAAWGTPALREWRLYVWGGMPGVSYGRAVMLDAHFEGRLPFELTCTLEELIACPGIGKVTAKKIYDAMTHAEVVV